MVGGAMGARREEGRGKRGRPTERVASLREAIQYGRRSNDRSTIKGGTSFNTIISESPRCGDRTTAGYCALRAKSSRESRLEVQRGDACCAMDIEDAPEFTAVSDDLDLYLPVSTLCSLFGYFPRLHGDDLSLLGLGGSALVYSRETLFAVFECSRRKDAEGEPRGRRHR